ncbi:MAG: MMPL family transporter [Acidimicrobiia bacterium]|nr:MMPL family transporter [Acidimicrobiia bacterium]
MTRLGQLAVRRRRLVIIAGVLVLLVAGIIGGSVSKHLSNGGFDDPNSEYSRASAIINTQFHSGEPNVVLLVTAKNGNVDSPAVAAEGLKLTQELASQPFVGQTVSYWSLGSPPPLHSNDSRSALVLARINGNDDQVITRAKDLAPHFTRDDAVASVRVGGFAQVFNQVGTQIRSDLERSEAITLPIVILLLVLVFGSVVAASLPLGVGVLAVMGTFLVLRGVAAITNVSIYSLNLTTAMGLGLAIDYSLFVVSRYREELRAGRETDAAVVRTVETAGRTVLFGALTVAASLCALLVFPLYFLRSFAYAGIPVVAFAAGSAVIILPAVLAALGPRIDKLVLYHHEPKPVGEGGWHRVAMAVMRRPVAFGLGVVLILVALGLPFLHVKFGLPDDRVLPASATSRQVQDEIRHNFASNESSPLEVVAANAPATPARDAAVDQYSARLSHLAGVARVDSLTGSYVGGQRVVGPNPASLRFAGQEGTWLSVVPSVEPLSAAGEHLVHQVRTSPAPFQVLVSGRSAQLVDSKQSVASHLPLALGLIGIITIVVLFLFTGSVVMPLKALVLNLLSLTATFGAMVWIFQDGHLSGLLGFTPTGTLDTSTPILMFCIVFGLSMDYEVFLLSRIKEEHDRTHDNMHSVAVGLEQTGRIVTAAAATLAVVFLAFGTSEITFIKLFGIGLALAVVMDATLIRAILVPAFMRLAGEANWWAPAPLRRLYDRIGLKEAPEDTAPTTAAPTDGLAAVLGVHRGARVEVVGAVDAELTKALERAAGRIARPTDSGSEPGADVIVLGARRASDLARLTDLAHHVKADGTIWVVRPEDNLAKSVRAHGHAAGLRDGPTVTLTDTYVGHRLDAGPDGNGAA